MVIRLLTAVRGSSGWGTVTRGGRAVLCAGFRYSGESQKRRIVAGRARRASASSARQAARWNVSSGQLLIVGAMGVVFAIVGFLVGVFFGMATLQLARGGRSAAYRDLVARHPWIRLMSGFWIIAWGVVVAVLARGFTHG